MCSTCTTWFQQTENTLQNMRLKQNTDIYQSKILILFGKSNTTVFIACFICSEMLDCNTGADMFVNITHSIDTAKFQDRRLKYDINGFKNLRN